MFSRITLPEMVKHGVNRKMALGIVAAAGTVASLIPPSLLMVVFGIMTEQSVSVLLIAGIVPGILSTIVYVIAIYIGVRAKPELAPRAAQLASWAERFRSLLPLWTVVAIFFIVVGGIYLGIFTPTQAAAVGAVATLILGLSTRRFSGRSLLGAIADSMVTSASIMLIMLGGAIFARMLSYSGLVREFSSTLLGWDLPSWVYLAVYLLLLLLLGMFLEAFSLLAIVVPLMYPLLMELGYHPGVDRDPDDQGVGDRVDHTAGWSEPVRGQGLSADEGESERNRHRSDTVHPARPADPRDPDRLPGDQPVAAGADGAIADR